MIAAGQPGPDPADAVREAARLSLAARGLRLWRARLREADGGWTEPWSWELGSAHPAARSVRLRRFFAKDSPWAEILDGVPRRWPWLGGDEPSEPGPEDGGEVIEVGRKWYFGGSGHRWIDWGEMRYGPARALWPLEAILGTIRATRAADTDVRGADCARYVMEILPGEAASREGTTLVDPPNADDDWRRIHCEVCIDSGGLIRRIAWSPAFGKRHSPGLVGRAAKTFGNDSAFDQDAAGRLWNVIEFWDYGCHVDIATPTDLADPHGGPSFREVIQDLRRMRREYRQQVRQPPPEPKLP
jgi:hypothetical protein